MSPSQVEPPTPSSLGAVDLDPWIPKPSTRDIVDHLVQEINAAKQVADEITCVQKMLDGMMAGESGGDVVQRVQRELEEKTRRVEELEGLLGVEREERRALEERIREMEDERALKMVAMAVEEEEKVEEKEASEGKGIGDSATETTLVKESSPEQNSPVTSLNIPDLVEEPLSTQDSQQDPTTSTTTAATSTTIEEPTTPPLSPSTAPSSPLQTSSSTRSVSPISLPSTESSHPDTTHLLERIAALEHQLQQAQQQIADYKSQLSSSSSILSTLSSGPDITTSARPSTPTGPVSLALGALTSSTDFPFTFSAPSTPGTSRRRPTGSLRSPRKRNSSQHPGEDALSETEVVSARDSAAARSHGKGPHDKEFVDGLCAAVGVVVLGWMGMWFINHLVQRGDRVVR